MFGFKKKDKVNAVEFCEEFYAKNFLEPVVAGMNMSDSYNELVLDNLKKADNSAFSISPINFKNEILSLRFELFSLAWFHQFGHKSAIANSMFTKQYLIDNGMGDLWEKGESYNQAIAASATHGYTSSTALGRLKLLDVNKTRVDLFKKYYDENIDAKCIARALNRYGTEANWKRLSITLGFIVIELCRNLKYDPNEEAQFQLTAVMKGFYDGVKQNIENIKIVN
jgi:hypothetical protein